MRNRTSEMPPAAKGAITAPTITLALRRRWKGMPERSILPATCRGKGTSLREIAGTKSRASAPPAEDRRHQNARVCANRECCPMVVLSEPPTHKRPLGMAAASHE
jgi:hypothetical protein